MLPLVSSAMQVPPPGSLAGHVVIVTGATGGLGRASALACARAGATVVLLGRKVRALEAIYDEIVSLGDTAQPAIYPMNLEGATPRDHDELAATLERELGRLDGIIHAAAHFDGLQPLDQMRPEEWLRTQHINVTAPFLLVRACMALLRAAPSAANVFVLDDVERMARPFWGGYGVAKHALAGMMAILHEENEHASLRIHGLLPAPMRTVLRRAAYYGEDTMALPLPDDAAATAAWLLTTEALPWRGKVLDLRPAA